MNLIEMIKGWFGAKKESKPKPTHPVKQQKGLNPKTKPKIQTQKTKRIPRAESPYLIFLNSWSAFPVKPEFMKTPVYRIADC